MQAAGHRGTVTQWVTAGMLVEQAWMSVGDGWRVQLDRTPDWLGNGRATRSKAAFPAASLMPLDGQAEPEAIAAGQPVGVEA
jgi:hypothetical protein